MHTRTASCLLLALALVACASPTPRGEAASRLRGHYVYFADAGLFTDCRSGERWPVLQEGDNRALESAYLRARRAPGIPALATVEGRVEPRIGPDGGAARRSLFVQRFVGIAPAEGCSGPQADESLENTYWKLAALGGVPFTSYPGTREVHFVLQPGRRVSGFSGCNRLMGGYTLEGERLSFGQLAGTRMACAQGGEQERAFLEMLGKAARWRVMGPWLELADANGQALAVFQAVHL